MRIGYLVPEFPGQTHIFFWRELQVLAARGVEVDVVSTRRPPPQLVSHAWAAEAMERTTYLARPSPQQIAESLREIGRSFPRSLGACLGSIGRAEGLDARGRLRLLALTIMGANLAGIARERGWSHVHVHSCADSAHVAMFARLLSGLPYSITLHGPLTDYGPNQREKWRHAKFGIVITRKLLDETRRDLAGALPPVVEIAPMGVDLQRFVRSVPYAAWDGSGPLRLFSCGRLNPCKGHGDLMDAVGILRAGGVDARLAIAGEDEAGGTKYRKVLESKLASSRLTDHVTLLGAVSEDRIRRELEGSHVFTLASLEEPLGVAIMEAMAMRMPVVVTGLGGVPELVTDGKDGVLVAPQKPAEMAQSIERVARQPQWATALGQSARKRIEDAFSSTISADILLRNIAGAEAGDWTTGPRSHRQERAPIQTAVPR